nr:MAG TPA: deoxyuridine 5'-triphosphate nucleotidohydrolase [Caudoviricetes sp.]
MSKIRSVLAKVISFASEQPMSYNEAFELLDGIDTCKVKIWLEEGAKMPKYAHEDDACMDLFVKNIELDSGRIIYHTGVHIALPEDYEMEIRPRSSITKTKSVIQNAPGTVDEGYRGEIMVVCRRIDSYDDPSYSIGDRVAQLLIRRRERIVWDEVRSLDELGYADRGDGGFGSTGK